MSSNFDVKLYLCKFRLDIGEGKEVNLVDKCHRSKLQQQCIKYLGPVRSFSSLDHFFLAFQNKNCVTTDFHFPFFAFSQMERKAYEVIVEDGKFLYKQTGELLDTTKGAKWIFVLSTSMTLYAGQKKKGSFQHSSFLAGGATSAAGRVVVEKGILKV